MSVAGLLFFFFCQVALDSSVALCRERESQQQTFEKSVRQQCCSMLRALSMLRGELDSLRASAAEAQRVHSNIVRYIHSSGGTL